MFSSSGILHLFPSPLAAGQGPDCLSPEVWAAVKRCTHFYWESEKAGRAFVKMAAHPLWPEGFTWELVNEHTRPPDMMEWLEPLLNGQEAGLVSDGGLPCLADPGSQLVARAQELGIKVVPHPGPSAIYLTLMASGLNGQAFQFNGYLPIDKKLRQQAIRSMEQRALRSGVTELFMETPYRNMALFDDLKANLQPGTLLCIGAAFGSPDGWVTTRSIQAWKNHSPQLHKVPCVFALNRSH